MGAWDFLVLAAGNPHAHKTPCFRVGRGLGVFWRGGGGLEVPILFYGRGDFLKSTVKPAFALLG